MTPSKPISPRSQSRSRGMCAVIGTPLRSMKAGISVATPAPSAAAKPGRCTSRKLRSEMSTAAYSRPAVTEPYATKCFAQAASDSADDRSVPWKPRTLARAMRALSQGSSPGPSALRPQRGSRETSSIGAKVIASPSAAPSRAASRAVRSQTSVVEDAGFSERDRKERAMAVDDVQTQQQRNAEPRLLHRQSLHLVRGRGADQVQQIADGAVDDRLRGVPRDHRPGERMARRGHRQLPQLLGQRHPGYQGVDATHRRLRSGTQEALMMACCRLVNGCARQGLHETNDDKPRPRRHEAFVLKDARKRRALRVLPDRPPMPGFARVAAARHRACRTARRR